MPNRINHNLTHTSANNQVQQTNLLTKIEKNTANINVNVGDVEINVQDVESLLTTTNTKLSGGLPSSLTGSGHLSISIDEIGNTGSEKLAVNLDTQISQHFPTALSGSGRLKVESHITDHSKESKQDTSIGHLSTIAGAVTGSEMQVDVLTMPTVAVTLSGGATEAKQDDGITHLATIAGDTTSIDGKITACNTGAVVISSSALPSGAATQSTLNDAEVHLGSIDGKITACNTGAVTISASALPSGAATQSTLNDAEVHLGNIETSVQLIDDAIVTDDSAVTLGSQKGVAIMGFAGTQSVNANDACMLACSTAGRLEVDVKNEVEVTNPGSFTVQEDGDALTALQLIDDVVVIDDAAVTLGSQKGVAIMGFAGTQSVNANDAAMLACSTAGRLEVDVKNTVSTAVTNTTLTNLNNCIGTNELQVDIVASLPTGSNAIGKLSANSGVDIGDVDVTSLPLTFNSGNKDATCQRVVVATDDVNLSAIKSSLDNIDNAVDGNYLNVNQNIAGTDVDGNSGNKSAQTQRVCIADDDTNLSAIKTSVELLDDCIGTDNSAGPSKCISIGGTNPLGGAIQEIAVDSSGHLSVDILSSAIPSGAATELSLAVVKTKATLATSAEVKELLSGITVNSGQLSSEFDTENYERIRFFGESTTSVGTDIVLMGSNESGGTFYILGENLRSETIGSTHYVYGSGTENLPRYIKILNKSGSSNYIFTKLYMQLSGGRLLV